MHWINKCIRTSLLSGHSLTTIIISASLINQSTKNKERRKEGLEINPDKPKKKEKKKETKA